MIYVITAKASLLLLLLFAFLFVFLQHHIFLVFIFPFHRVVKRMTIYEKNEMV